MDKKNHCPKKKPNQQFSLVLKIKQKSICLYEKKIENYKN